MRHSEILTDLKLYDLNPVIFGHEDCKPLHSYGPAVRSHWLLHYVVSGKGFFTREGVTYKVKKGSLFVIPPYIETFYEADSEDPWTYIWIGFTTKNEVPSCFLSPITHCPEAEIIFDEMRQCSKKSKGKEAFLLAKLWELVSCLSEDEKSQIGYVDKAIQCMKNEYMNPLSISDIANRFGLDRSYFSNLFKAETGISPGKYLTNIRLSTAAEFLVKHGTSPTVAALSCGFADIYHFSKAFKKHYGLSPRAYKEQYKKDSNETLKSDTL